MNSRSTDEKSVLKQDKIRNLKTAFCFFVFYANGSEHGTVGQTYLTKITNFWR